MLQLPFSALQPNSWFPPAARPAFIFQISVSSGGANQVQTGAAAGSLQMSGPRPCERCFISLLPPSFVVFVRRFPSYCLICAERVGLRGVRHMCIHTCARQPHTLLFRENNQFKSSLLIPDRTSLLRGGVFSCVASLMKD